MSWHNVSAMHSFVFWLEKVNWLKLKSLGREVEEESASVLSANCTQIISKGNCYTDKQAIQIIWKMNHESFPLTFRTFFCYIFCLFSCNTWCCSFTISDVQHYSVVGFEGKNLVERERKREINRGAFRSSSDISCGPNPKLWSRRSSSLTQGRKGTSVLFSPVRRRNVDFVKLKKH